MRFVEQDTGCRIKLIGAGYITILVHVEKPSPYCFLFYFAVVCKLLCLTGREVTEQDQPLHFLLMCDSQKAIDAAKELLNNLIQTVM